MRRCAVVFVALGLLACSPSEADEEAVAAEAVDDAAVALHAALLEAARDGDVPGFRARLSRASVALFETHFDSVGELPRPQGAEALGWADVLAFHAELPPDAARRAPYPLIEEDGQPRLHLVAHADARFFEAIALRVQTP